MNPCRAGCGVCRRCDGCGVLPLPAWILSAFGRSALGAAASVFATQPQARPSSSLGPAARFCFTSHLLCVCRGYSSRRLHPLPGWGIPDWIRSSVVAIDLSKCCVYMVFSLFRLPVFLTFSLQSLFANWFRLSLSLSLSIFSSLRFCLSLYFLPFSSFPSFLCLSDSCPLFHVPSLYSFSLRSLSGYLSSFSFFHFIFPSLVSLGNT